MGEPYFPELKGDVGYNAAEAASVPCTGPRTAAAGARMRTPDQVAATALAQLERRDPGPSVVDGSANRMSAALTRMPSRRTAVRLMDRVSDPARRR